LLFAVCATGCSAPQATAQRGTPAASATVPDLSGGWLRLDSEGSGSFDGTARIWNPATGKARVLLQLATSTGESECIEVDHVIAATGYCYDLDRLDLLDPGLRDDIHTVGGFPHLSSHLESSVPGLYFTGLAAGGTFGPVMRFVCGTEFAGPRVAGSIARRRQRRSAAA